MEEEAAEEEVVEGVQEEEGQNSGQQAPAASPQAPSGEERRTKGADPLHVDSFNAQLHLAFVSRDYNTAKALVAELEKETGGQSEYALIVRGTIAREEGDLNLAVDCFSAAVQLAPSSARYAQELGRAHFLAGRHTAAVESLEKAVHLDATDARTHYWLARALYHLDSQTFQGVDKARQLLSAAVAISPSPPPAMLSFLARLQEQSESPADAVHTYKRLTELCGEGAKGSSSSDIGGSQPSENVTGRELGILQSVVANELEPESLDALVSLGVLCMRLGDEEKAFSSLGRALAMRPSHSPAILAAGAIIQAHGDHDVALSKYRVAAGSCEYDGCIWNNIGMCLYAKGKLVAAISCLKKAAYLCPLQPKILFNLGMVHLSMGQTASAYHFLAAALALQPNSPHILGIIAVTLTRLGDTVNARRAYAKALSSSSDPQLQLNAAIFELKAGDSSAAAVILTRFRDCERVAHPDSIPLSMRSMADRLERAITEVIQSRESPPTGPSAHPSEPQ